MSEDSGVQCVTWKQFQIGITAVFTANVAITLLVFFADSRSTNTNTNIIQNPDIALRDSLARSYMEKQIGLRDRETGSSGRVGSDGAVDGR
jgi:hypothetical protein